MSDLYIGIDPGKAGGIAWLHEGKMYCQPMPDTELDLWKLLGVKLASKSIPTHALIEQVHAMPQQGVTSVFTFGTGYGGLRMALTAASIPFELVTPQVWQKGLRIPRRYKKETNNQWKTRLLKAAQQMYPTLKLWSKPKSKGKQLAVADAILICE